MEEKKTLNAANLTDHGDYIISKIKLPDNYTYELHDADAAHAEDLEGLKRDLEGNTATDTKDSKTIVGAKKYADELISGLGSVLNFKGTKNTEVEIKALTDSKKGDVWINKADSSEWLCTENLGGIAKASAWEQLGNTSALVGYVTKTEHNAHTHTIKTIVGENSPSSVSGTASIAENKVVTAVTPTTETVSVNRGTDVAIDDSDVSTAVTGFNAPGTFKAVKELTIGSIGQVTGNTSVTVKTMEDAGTASSWSFTMDTTDPSLLVISGANSVAPTGGTADVSKVTSASASVATGIKTTDDAIKTINPTTDDFVQSVSISAQPAFTLSKQVVTAVGSTKGAVTGDVSGTAQGQTWTLKSGETNTPATPLS